VAHYERRLREAGIVFQTKPDAAGVSVEAFPPKAVCKIRIVPQDGGANVEVKYALKSEPAPAAETPDRVLGPLLLEWPDWLETPRGRLVSKRTNPRGRIGQWSEESCPGDVLGKPSQGCLKRVYETSAKLNEVYQYFADLLEQHGYTTHIPNGQVYADMQLGKWIADVFGSLTMREYPDPRVENQYRQLNIFLRQPSATTKVEITFLVKNGDEAPPPATPAHAAASGLGHLSFPPPRGTWRWAMQSVAVNAGHGIRYTAFYYEAASGRSVDEPLTLPEGGVITGVFPDDCSFSIREGSGSALAFRNQDEAANRRLPPGTWSLYPKSCGGVALFVR
jgi:hypothetical protein